MAPSRSVTSAQQKTSIGEGLFPASQDLVNEDGVGMGSLRFIKVSRRVVIPIILLVAAQWLLAITTISLASIHEPAILESRSAAVAASDGVASLIGSEKVDTYQEWGCLHYSPIVISAPSEIARYMDPSRYNNDWYLPEMSHAEFDALLADFDVTPAMRAQLFEISEFDPNTNRRRIPVTNALIGEIPTDARAKLYAYIAEDNLNFAQANAFRFAADSFDEWFDRSEVRPELRERIRNLVYRQGCYLVFADVRLIVADLRNQEEQIALFKTLTRVKTFFVTLQVDQDSDIASLVRYWGRRGRANEVRTFFESLSLNPERGIIDVSHLLPAFARRRVYTYPSLSTDPLSLGYDCHWTAHNFFNPIPNDDIARDLNELPRRLGEDYYQVYGDFRFGDIVTYVDENDLAFHSAVYIAEDVVFTKNGPDPLRPWFLCRMKEMRDFYPRRKAVRTMFYRPKQS